MLRKYGFLGGMLGLLFAFGLMSCEGDVGPVGPEGEQGPVGDQGPIGPEGPAGSGVGFHNTPSPGYGWGGTWVTDASVDFDVTETQSLVYFQADVGVWHTGVAACKAAIRLTFDGTPDDLTLASIDLPATQIGGNNLGMLMTSRMRTFSQGTHTVTLEREGCSTSKHPHLNVIVLGN
ncbi:MAG: collagen-like protein [Gemmatimonadota bacterium]|nr:MAG: collagen-like protein [Gemmatimonadota bacterium]